MYFAANSTVDCNFKIMQLKNRHIKSLSIAYILYFSLFVLTFDIPFFHSGAVTAKTPKITNKLSSAEDNSVLETENHNVNAGDTSRVSHFHTKSLTVNKICFLCAFGFSLNSNSIKTVGSEFIPLSKNIRNLSNFRLVSLHVSCLPSRRAPPTVV